MNENSSPKKLSSLESFFQFDINKLTEKQKNNYSIIALISSIIWLLLEMFGILFGLIWMVIISGIFFKIVMIGLKSSKKWMSKVSIIFYAMIIICYVVIIV